MVVHMHGNLIAQRQASALVDRGQDFAPQQLLLSGEPLPFAVTPIAGKGHGCIATSHIEQGERILAERPLIEQGPGKPSLRDTVGGLRPAELEAFFELSQNEAGWGSTKHVAGLYATNGIPSGQTREHSAIFLTASRLNHS